MKKGRIFRLGRLPGGGARSVKPSEAATFVDLRAAIETAYLTVDEARHLGIAAIRRAHEIKGALDKSDSRLYRQPNAEEVKGITCLPDEEVGT